MHLQAVTCNEMQVFHFPWEFAFPPPRALLITMCPYRKQWNYSIYSDAEVQPAWSIAQYPQSRKYLPTATSSWTLLDFPKSPLPPKPPLSLSSIFPLANSVACLLQSTLGWPVLSFGQMSRLSVAAQKVPAEADSPECKALGVVLQQQSWPISTQTQTSHNFPFLSSLLS